MKTIKNFINACCQNIHAHAIAIICTIGLRREARKKRKAEKKYKQLLNNFTFVLTPTDVFDRLVIFKGNVYRIQFEKEGFLVRNELTDASVEDPLLIVQLLNEIK